MTCHTCGQPMDAPALYIRWHRAVDTLDAPSCEACIAKFERISGKNRAEFAFPDEFAAHMQSEDTEC